MANGYSVRDYTLGGSVAVSASSTNETISTEIPISAADSKNICFRIEASAAVEDNTITLKLQEYRGTTWHDVGSAAEIAAVSVEAADADVSTANDNVTETSHPFETGDAVYYKSSAGNNITGLSDETIYYVIDEAADTFQLATTRANAIAGTAIGLTQPSGGDTHRFTRVEYDLDLNIENSTDEGVLPLWPKVRWVATTGSGDSITIDKVYVTRRY